MLAIDFAWTQAPLIVSAPMRLITLAPVAVSVSQAGGLGFLAAGTDVRNLENELQRTAELLKESPIKLAANDTLPVGVGFINWGANLHAVLDAFQTHVPAAVWFFAPKQNSDLVEWSDKIRGISKGKTKIWIQIGTVADAIEVASLCNPDALVVQGADAGGHGLAQGAGIITLFPEVSDALNEAGKGDIPLIAAGGIAEGRGVAACVALGASGVAMGTRFLACTEAHIAKGYQDDVVRANDGGTNTVRTSVYDQVRGTTGWPTRYNGRGIINETFLDALKGMSKEENEMLYSDAMRESDNGWGEKGRMTAYAGTGVGLIKSVMTSSSIVETVRRDAKAILCKAAVVHSHR